MGTIGFIGAGNMGGALIRGLVEAKTVAPTDLVVAEPRDALRDDMASRFPGIRVTDDNRLAAESDVLVLAVKPGIYPDVIAGIAGTVGPETLVVTIAAGPSIHRIVEWFGKSVRVIRALPNTPALVGAGMTALCPGEGVEAAELETVRALFGAVGETTVLPEDLMDAFTAVSSSSPAWVFIFLEALADGAVLEGIPRDDAYRIAAQAIMGSAKLALETGDHPGVLKDRVCSPGGTTIEAVATLEEAGFRSAVISAVRDCTEKARTLGRR